MISCPECGSARYVSRGGCETCQDCGYSPCQSGGYR